MMTISAATSAVSDSRLSQRENRRLERTLTMIPAAARTGLEIGFFDLRLTKLLQSRVDVTSIDLPRPVGPHDGYRLAFADIARLPFRDEAFDVVICTEVLEHLTDEALHRGISEMVRVSRRHVLISVPYRQRVWNELFRCRLCGHVCNNMGHLRMFDDGTLESMFAPARLMASEKVGTLPGYAPDWLYSAARRYGSSWYRYNSFDSCPNCSATVDCVPPNALGHLLRRVIWRIEARAMPRPAWLIALLDVRS